MTTEATALRVVIADDSVLLREGLSRLLEESGFEVAGQAGGAEDLLRKVGARPFVQGVSLWIIVSVLTLTAIMHHLIS